MSDVYSTPESDLIRDDQNIDYGSVKKAIAGDYQFKVFDVLGEAWDKTSGVKGSIWLAMVFYMLVAIGISFVVVLLGMLIGADESPVMAITEQLAVSIIGTPMLVGMFMIGLKRSVNAPKSGTLAFSYFHRLWPLFLAMVMIYVLVTLGLILLIIPGLYLAVAYYFSTALIVEKEMSPWQAMETSRKAITKRWFSFLGLIIMTFLINIAGALALLIGLIWTIPMSMMAFAIVYRNMFGVESINRQ